jgi:hypothetical protein
MSTSSHPFDALTVARTIPAPSTVSPELYAEVARLGLGDDFPAAIALTRELFGDFIIQIAADPEIHNCSYVTFNVHTRDSVESALEKETEWFRRVNWPTEAEGGFCLNVNFDE